MRHTDELAGMTDRILELMRSEGYVPMDMRDMTDVLRLGRGSYDLFAEALYGLEHDGLICTTKRGKLILAGGGGLSQGVFHSTSRGYGFVTPDGGGEDIFIPREHSLDAMNGDRVRFAAVGDSGEIRAVLERAVTEVTGSFRVHIERTGRRGRKFRRPAELRRCFVKPDDPKYSFRIKIPPTLCGNAEDGDKVSVGIIEYPRDGEATGRILRVFGKGGSREANYRAILYENGIRTRFDREVLDNAAKAASEPIVADGRLDLRDKLSFTVDGSDAKDFDDAISLERDGEGWLLYVHIADVSHYVKPGSPLDREAFERGTSLYFTDKVVPMLPEELSNGSCSLLPGEDRYTLTAILRLGAGGELLKTTLRRAVIRSSIRCVYSEVNELIDSEGDPELREKYQKLIPILPELLELYGRLSERSFARGALELETAESVITLGEDGLPVDISRRRRGVAERMIEQFMLCANEGVARWLTELGMPCVYRVHGESSPERVQNFSMFAYNLGLDIRPLRRRKLTPSCFAEVCAEASERGLDAVLTVMLLRSLAKAKYSSAPSPHFGLGLELYCHFTSPIRRYPDLAVHRIIGAILDGNADREQLSAFAGSAAERSSENELRALNAERAIEELYRVLFMSDKLGEEFDGVISSVTSFGLFVELDNTCEGLIPIGMLDGYFEYDERTFTLSCGNTVYRLGQRLRVILTDCDIPSRRIGFLPVG